MIYHGDCLDVMAEMEPASVDSVVTDPPYGLEFMGKTWDRLGANSDRWEGRRTRTAGSVPVREPTTPGGRHAATTSAAAPNSKCATCGHYKFSGTPCRCETPVWIARPNEQSRRMQAWHQRWAEAAYRVAKPSAYLLAFGGTRTVHRLASAIEDAGWIIRDLLVWGYASGFPKSKASLKPAWEPIVMARKPGPLRMLAIDSCRIPMVTVEGAGLDVNTHLRPNVRRTPGDATSYQPHREESRYEIPAGRWPANIVLTDPIFDGGIEGVVGGSYGGTLTTCPLCDAPVVERSSTTVTLGGSAPANASPPVGALNTTARLAASERSRVDDATARSDAPTLGAGRGVSMGLGPTHLVRPESPHELSGSGSATRSELWPDHESPSGQLARNAAQRNTSSGTTRTTRSPWTCGHSAFDATTGSTLESTGGGYNRFFLLPKADRSDREPVLGGLPSRVVNITEGHGLGPVNTSKGGDGIRENRPRSNVHPTVKPTDLMRHLVRLVTPTGGVVLDPFLGSGTTAIAAEMEGFDWIGIEKEAEYVQIAEARLNGVQMGLGLPV